MFGIRNSPPPHFKTESEPSRKPQLTHACCFIECGLLVVLKCYWQKSLESPCPKPQTRKTKGTKVMSVYIMFQRQSNKCGRDKLNMFITIMFQHCPPPVGLNGCIIPNVLPYKRRLERSELDIAAIILARSPEFIHAVLATLFNTGPFMAPL